MLISTTIISSLYNLLHIYEWSRTMLRAGESKRKRKKKRVHAGLTRKPKN